MIAPDDGASDRVAGALLLVAAALAHALAVLGAAVAWREAGGLDSGGLGWGGLGVSSRFLLLVCPVHLLVGFVARREGTGEERSALRFLFASGLGLSLGACLFLADRLHPGVAETRTIAEFLHVGVFAGGIAAWLESSGWIDLDFLVGGEGGPHGSYS